MSHTTNTQRHKLGLAPLKCVTHDRDADECNRAAQAEYGPKNLDGFTNCTYVQANEWLEAMIQHAIDDLRQGVGFTLAGRTMTQFSADYRNGNRPGTTPKTPLRYEVGSRAYFAMEDEATR